MALPREFSDRLERSVVEVLARSRASGKASAYCIGTTMNEGNEEYFVSAIRESEYHVCGNVMITHTRDLGEIARILNGRVDEILIDVERKRGTCAGVEEILKASAGKSSLGYFRGNEVAASSFEHILMKVCGMKGLSVAGLRACVVGTGHLGAKIAGILVEYGAEVDLLDADGGRALEVSRAIITMTARHCRGKVVAVGRTEMMKREYSLIVGVTNGVPAIDVEMIACVKDGGFIVDAGLRTLTDESIEKAGQRGLLVFCLMAKPGFGGMMATRFHAGKVAEKIARRDSGAGFSLVSGGVIGNSGDIIVDDAADPREVIGVAKGNGLVLAGAEKDAFRDRIETVMDMISVKNKHANQG